jgi:UDP-N-acetylglucosamine 2-epimerase
MPEELNRILTDHLSDQLFCPTQTAIDNLGVEGIIDNVHNVGDIMYDAVLHNRKLASATSQILGRLGLEPGNYLLATIHRPRNTDDPVRLKAIIEAFARLQSEIVFPAHPRTRKALGDHVQHIPANVQIIDPVGYLDMLQLEQHSKAILTDSGGIQKEAYFTSVPCITLREETEWIETVHAGWNCLVGADTEKIVKAVEHLTVPTEHPTLFGTGETASAIVAVLELARDQS